MRLQSHLRLSKSNIRRECDGWFERAEFNAYIMMIYFHCSDLHVTPRQRDRNTRSTCCFLHGRLGFGEVYPLLLLIQCNEMKIICSMLKMVMLVSKERKSTRFFHSFFDFHSDKTTPSMDGNGNRHIGKAESQPCRRCSQNRRKTQRESGDRPEEKCLPSVPTEFIAIFLNVDIRLESIWHC